MGPVAEIKVVSFDCFGTLVDSEAGLGRAITSVLGLIDPAEIRQIVATRADAEWNIITELEDYISYREILARSLVDACRALEIPIDGEQAARIGGTIDSWPLYDDVDASLARLAARYRLALVSNVDHGDLGDLAERLGVEIEHTVASDDVLCFKPEPDHLLSLLHEMELDEDELIHVTAEPDYDLYAAEDLGIATAYVDRRGEELPGDVAVRHRARNLAELTDKLLRRARRGMIDARPARRSRRR